MKREVLRLHERLGLSHRKLADTFNQRYFASTGMTVGRTWVRGLLMKHAYEALHRQRDWKRFFGSFKACLRTYVIRDARHLAQSLKDFRFWYNETRTHQHLHGLTPAQAWQGIDPFCQAPRQVQWFAGWDGRLQGMVLRH